MAYRMVPAEGSLDQDKTTTTAYRILDSGVLQILETTRAGASNQDHWIVKVEHAPHTWVSVEGTRYVTTTEDASGTNGRVVKGKYYES